MGFLNPGKSKKRKRGDKSKSNNDKSIEKKLRVSSPLNLSLNQSYQSTSVLTNDFVQDLVEDIIVETPVIDTQASILEKFPTEILHEIFIHSGINNLPFVNKTLMVKLKASHSLIVRLLQQNYIHDLNRKLPIDFDPQLVKEWKRRFALDKEVLNYKFITADILKSLTFDTVSSLKTIEAESKNRLILYYDKSNKKLLETMMRLDMDAEEVNQELSRMAEERFNLQISVDGDEELSDLPTEDFQDFEKKFYTNPIKYLEIVEELHKREIRFINGDLALCNSIKFNESISLDQLKRVLGCTELGVITTSTPLIEAFELKDFKIADWIISKCKDDFDIINDDDLWIYITKRKDLGILKYMESKGGVPNHEILGLLNSFHG